MENDFSFLVSLWKNYNSASTILTKAMGGTKNEVGEFAERLVARYYNAAQLTASNKSADLRTQSNKLIQVKSRKIEHLTTTSLNVIRSWDFDLLVVVLFSTDGDIIKAIEITAQDAKPISKWNEHQNGYVLTTSKDLLENCKAKDITEYLQNIIDGRNSLSHSDFDETKQSSTVINSKDNDNHQRYVSSLDNYDELAEIKRVQSRLPGWFLKREQINSKILYAFIRLFEQNSNVRYTALEREVNLPTFKQNFEQMKTIAPHNHGKIFEQKGDFVCLWNKVEKTIWDCYKRYGKQGHST